MRRLLAAGLASAALVGGFAAPASASQPQKETYVYNGCWPDLENPDYLFCFDGHTREMYTSPKKVEPGDIPGDYDIRYRYVEHNITTNIHTGEVIRECTIRFHTMGRYGKVPTPSHHKEKCEP